MLPRCYFRGMILVTGASGLLGARLVYDLVESGRRVRALVRGPEPRRDVLSHYFDSTMISMVEWVQGDILDPISLVDVFKDVEYVFHCAGKVSFIPRESVQMQEVNVIGTANIVNACLNSGVS